MAKFPTKVLSSAALTSAAVVVGFAGTASAAVDGYLVKDAEGTVYSFDKAELEQSYMNYVYGDGDTALYEYFQELFTENGFYAFSDDSGKYVAYDAIEDAYLEDTEGFDINEFTEGEDAPAAEVTTVTKVTVEDGEIVTEEISSGVSSDVADVDADNLKEVVVEFTSTEYDEELVKDPDSYSITDENGNDLAVAEVSVDGTTAVLTLKDGDEGTNQLSATLTVDKEVLGADEDVETEFTFFDATVPEAEKIELIGPNKFKIYFSEPIVNVANQSTVEVENGIYGVADITTDGNAAIVTLSASSLSEDEYSVKVSGFEDYAGYKALDKEFTLDYTKDTEAPTATIKKASQTQVVVKFSEPVETESGSQLTADYFYHSYSAYKPNDDAELGIDAVTVSADGTEYTLNFTDNPLPEGNVKFVVDYNANDELVQDEWGNTLAENMVFTVKVEADKEKPEVTKVDVVDEQTINIYFSEDVVKSDAEDKDNYVFEDADGEEVTPSDITYHSNSDDEEYYAEVKFSSDLNGNYTVDISDIDDKALNANTLEEVTFSFNVEDLTGPDLTKVKAIGVEGSGDDPDLVYIYFPEKMATSGEYSILDKKNYQINGEDLGSKDQVTLFKDSSAVKIVLDDNTSNLSTFTVSRLADASGNPSAKLYHSGGISADTSPVITGVEVLDYKTIKITIDKPLKTVVADGFEVTNNGTTDTLAAVSWEINDDNETVVTGTLKADTQVSKTDSSDLVDEVSIVADKLVSETGYSVDAFTFGDDAGETVADGYAPTLAENGAASTVANKIDLTFTESVTAGTMATQALASSYFKVFIDGDELSFVTSLAELDDSSEFFVEFGADDETVSIYVYDQEGNEAEIEFSANKYFTDTADTNKVEDFSVTVDVYGE
ncbi:MAG: hypothetical protein H0Z32_09495 [Bacillaceae bacterium]|nr:hypothetical protein [Bacillaceae bacterium]